MAEVWFIRHGESLSNAGHVVENTATVPLTAKGRAQAMAISSLFDTAPDLIVTTPYLRTQLTAEPTLQRFPASRQEVWDLQEFACLSLVHYANTNSEQRAPFVKAYWQRQDPDYIDGEGAESFNGLLGRIRKNLERLQTAPEKFVVVFCHGHTMQTMRYMLERPNLSPRELMKAVPEYFSRTEIANGAVIHMTADENGVRLHAADKLAFEAGFNNPPLPKNPPKRGFSMGNY